MIQIGFKMFIRVFFSNFDFMAAVPLKNPILMYSFEQNLSKYLSFFRGWPSLMDFTCQNTCRRLKENNDV